MGYFEISRTSRPKITSKHIRAHHPVVSHRSRMSYLLQSFFFSGTKTWRHPRALGSLQPREGYRCRQEFSCRLCRWQPGQRGRLAQRRGCFLATPSHTPCFLIPRKGKKATLKPKDTRLTRRPSKNCLLQGAPRSVGWRNAVIKDKNEYAWRGKLAFWNN